MSLLAVTGWSPADFVLAASVSPSPEPGVVTPPADLVTPGTVGFLVTFLVAVALVLLVRDMNRRVRRIRVRGEREEQAGPGTQREDGDDPGDGVIRRHH
ncbi:hypothetical protein [Aquipuribacter sp. SD81]|uniref:hypothetical protein n=1 Tax=Aquipuribacter sp. SD81 TaxID=3127703 RepID=UPI003018D5CA